MINNDRTDTQGRREGPGASQNRDFPSDPLCRPYTAIQRENRGFGENRNFCKFILYAPDRLFRSKFDLYHLKR